MPEESRAIKTDTQTSGKKGAKPAGNITEGEILEGDLRDRQALNSERMQDMRQARRMRGIVFKWVALPFIAASALISAAMLLCLGLAIYAPNIWGGDRAPLLTAMGEDGAAWPLGVLILGTFFSFIAFAALAFGILAPRNKGDESPAKGALRNMTNRGTQSGNGN